LPATGPHRHLEGKVWTNHQLIRQRRNNVAHHLVLVHRSPGPNLIDAISFYRCHSGPAVQYVSTIQKRPLLSRKVKDCGLSNYREFTITAYIQLSLQERLMQTKHKLFWHYYTNASTSNINQQMLPKYVNDISCICCICHVNIFIMVSVFICQT